MIYVVQRWRPSLWWCRLFHLQSPVFFYISRLIFPPYDTAHRSCSRLGFISCLHPLSVSRHLQILRQMGEFDRASAIGGQALALVQTGPTGPHSAESAVCVASLAGLAAQQGKPTLSEELYRYVVCVFFSLLLASTALTG